MAFAIDLMNMSQMSTSKAKQGKGNIPHFWTLHRLPQGRSSFFLQRLKTQLHCYACADYSFKLTLLSCSFLPEHLYSMQRLLILRLRRAHHSQISDNDAVYNGIMEPD